MSIVGLNIDCSVFGKNINIARIHRYSGLDLAKIPINMLCIAFGIALHLQYGETPSHLSQKLKGTSSQSIFTFCKVVQHRHINFVQIRHSVLCKQIVNFKPEAAQSTKIVPMQQRVHILQIQAVVVMPLPS